MMKPTRAVVDVSALPTVTFGARSVTWWATAAFMVIEGTTLALCVASYFYLHRNFQHWPPPRTPLPHLPVPTIQMAFMLATLVPVAWLRKKGKAMDLRGVQIGMMLKSVFGAVVLALRVFEFPATNTRWDSHAYGSIVWITLGFQTTLLLVDAVESWVLTAIVWGSRFEMKHFSDVEDDAIYWWFTVLTWLPLYVMIFLSPRFI